MRMNHDKIKESIASSLALHKAVGQIFEIKETELFRLKNKSKFIYAAWTISKSIFLFWGRTGGDTK